MAQERALLTAQVRASATRLQALLAEDFVEFGASGRRYTRQEIVAELAQESDQTRYSADAFECVELAPGLVQLRYVSRREDADGVRLARRSSLWRQETAGWRMVFHQGTPLPDALDAG
ncbi:nuclear transport factor 2 family protein [Pseudoxanthomonas winnipegensis]|uniref:Nuclear transport factor 2 family protein n=1 Tax=Pseudoxanthomonas winnipegensis TaxID=2480810 RepID=A0A4Q8LVU8_9GAMM|nr:nuclear transport factor 2 family protein [Pseudoxanthomonas winnipegensis]TAA36202.1 nuclear transport factor 2 family protein [Pseudoxanthomonas winnipegensis]